MKPLQAVLTWGQDVEKLQMFQKVPFFSLNAQILCGWDRGWGHGWGRAWPSMTPCDDLMRWARTY